MARMFIFHESLMFLANLRKGCLNRTLRAEDTIDLITSRVY